MFVTSQQISNAMGPFQSTQQKNYYQKMQKYFSVMKKPDEGDWLFGHKQKAQLFTDYREPYINYVSDKRKTIYIQPFGKFNQKFMNSLKEFCEIFYTGMKVVISNEIQFDSLTVKLNKRKNIFGDQYICNDILQYMKKIVPKDAYCVMGVTLKDLYPGPNWNFVYGWASYVHRVAIFSFIRWDPEFGYGETKQMDWNKILYPSMRTMVHQIGHMFGITHCIYYDCLMNGYNNIEQNYQNPLQFCPVCYKKIISNLKFNSEKRYDALIKYFKRQTKLPIERQLKLYNQLSKIAVQYPIKIILNNNKPNQVSVQNKVPVQTKISVQTNVQTKVQNKVQIRGTTTQKKQKLPIINKQKIKKPQIANLVSNVRAISVDYRNLNQR